MKHYYIFFTAAVLLLSVAGCGQKKGPAEKAPDGKLGFQPERNEVNVIVLKRETFRQQLIANGKLSAMAKSSLEFGSSGVISGIFVKNGDVVHAGALIAKADDTDKRLALESAKTAMDKARLDLYDKLVGLGYQAKDTNAVPDNILKVAKIRSGYTEAETSLLKAENELAKTELRAPFGGRVADISAKRYDKTPSGTFCTLIDDKMFDVDFNILESEYQFIEKGLPVKVMPFISTGKPLTGYVTVINPKIDKNGQIAVRASVRNDGTLLEGMNVKVIVEKSVAKRLVVPKSAVVIRDNMDVLFRYHKGKAEWVYVLLPMSNSESFAVEANTDRGAVLEAGDSVIVSGNLNLADNSDVILKKD
ncbi:MAG: efflux RND transporter periplasmic adaptor subunit [Bacteroidales bacterium]|jgi:RND family efflux transporter MFP subunit|nr:efflux RND transporter periplasmic adaptor subunit [Bacteroidales bacterium]MCI1785602.1 efflux RND transporter periplasmic adaptor subunit [Bacteroidales bacterium]